MPPIQPSKLWTLRLKNGTRTVMLFADPAQSLTSLKAALLEALRRAPKADPRAYTAPPPSSISDIEIGKPLDIFDLSQGWELVVSDPDPVDEPPEDTTGKGKDKGKGKAKSNGTEMSLRSLGIKENWVLAWRVKVTDGNDDETLGDDQGWQVEIPAYDDAYGVENQGDGGALPEFRG
jgi:hypothetical protein